MDIELINIDKQEVCEKFNNKDKEYLFELLDKKDITDIKVIYKLREGDNHTQEIERRNK